jgi:uncharacterized membrane protein YfcA
LIGVGGGEFRIPALLYVLGFPVITAVAVNLFIGLLTVIVSFLRRLQLGLFNEHAIHIASIMSLGSLIGAYFGAFLTARIAEKPLKKVLAIFLIFIGLKVGLEPFTYTSFSSLTFMPNAPQEIILAFLLGIAIGIISGILGVAGGEFRIPALIYLFSFDVVLAGTTSLLVSIPTVASGFAKHRQMGHINRSAAAIAIIMGAASVLGAWIGSSYAGVIDKDVLKVLLGIILVLATIRMVTKP